MLHHFHTFVFFYYDIPTLKDPGSMINDCHLSVHPPFLILIPGFLPGLTATIATPLFFLYFPFLLKFSTDPTPLIIILMP